jgi:hypothetical protein
MSTCLVFALGAVVGFAAGWVGHDWWKRSQAQEKVVEVLRKPPKFTTFGLTYLAMFAIFIGAVVLGDVRADNKVSQSEKRQNDHTTTQLACLSRTFEDFLTGNQKLRDASAKRDAALLGSKKALRELIRLRVVEQVQDSGAVQQAADQYLVQTQNFIDASEALDDARKAYKLPDFEKRCGKLAPRIRDVLYRDLQEPPWMAQLTGGASLE